MESITKDKFDDLTRSPMSLDSSWAVWRSNEGQRITEADTHDMSVLDPTVNAGLLSTIHTEFVFVGLNRGTPQDEKYARLPGVDQPWGVFHCGARDTWLANGLVGTSGWGAFMTDIFKGPEWATLDAPACLKKARELDNNKGGEAPTESALDALEQQLEDLGTTPASLVAVGSSVRDILMPRWPKVPWIYHYARYSTSRKPADFPHSLDMAGYRAHLMQTLHLS